jgi:hypothetical protein
MTGFNLVADQGVLSCCGKFEGRSHFTMRASRHTGCGDTCYDCATRGLRNYVDRTTIAYDSTASIVAQASMTHGTTFCAHCNQVGQLPFASNLEHINPLAGRNVTRASAISSDGLFSRLARLIQRVKDAISRAFDSFVFSLCNVGYTL